RPPLPGGRPPSALGTGPGNQEGPRRDERDDQREARAAGTDDDRALGGVHLHRARRLGLPEAGPEARRGRRGVLSVPPVALGRGRLTVATPLRPPLVPVPAVGCGLAIGLIGSPPPLGLQRHARFRRPPPRAPPSAGA